MYRQLNILLVEDSHSNSSFALETLPKVDGKMTVSVARTLTEAVQRLRGEKFDLVLLDLAHPDESEAWTVGRLQDLHPDVVVVVLSTLGEPDGPESLALMVRRDFIRQETARQYAPARASLDETGRALNDAHVLEGELDKKHKESK